MSTHKMNWQAVSEALGITTETCTVYRAPRKQYREHKRRFTKDAAISDAITQLTRNIIPCDCQAAEPDTMEGRGDPGNYCGCLEKREVVFDTLMDVVRQLPAAAEEWAKVTSDEHWEDADWRKLITKKEEDYYT
jgi:hypothetical protein